MFVLQERSAFSFLTFSGAFVQTDNLRTALEGTTASWKQHGSWDKISHLQTASAVVDRTFPENV